MSVPVLILGESGTGKSASLRNFKRGEIAVVNVLGKPMPFRADLETVNVASYCREQEAAGNGKPLYIDVVRSTVINGSRAHDAVIVDDFGYCITEMFMRWTTGTEQMKDQFGVYKEIASRVWNLLMDVAGDGIPERIVYFTMHTETDNAGNVVPLTVGKLLNEKINIKGICTCILQTAVINDEYRFIVNGGNPAKSPIGMFKGNDIDNDLKLVDKSIRRYYGFKAKGGE